MEDQNQEPEVEPTPEESPTPEQEAGPVSRRDKYILAAGFSPVVVALILAAGYIVLPQSFKVLLEGYNYHPWLTSVLVALASIITIPIARENLKNKDLRDFIRTMLILVLISCLCIGVGAFCHWCGESLDYIH